MNNKSNDSVWVSFNPVAFPYATNFALAKELIELLPDSEKVTVSTMCLYRRTGRMPLLIWCAIAEHYPELYDIKHTTGVRKYLIDGSLLNNQKVRYFKSTIANAVKGAY